MQAHQQDNARPEKKIIIIFVIFILLVLISDFEHQFSRFNSRLPFIFFLQLSLSDIFLD